MTSRSVSTIQLSAGRVAGGVISLGSAMVLARFLTPEGYGMYRQVWLIYETVLPFLMLGLPASVAYYIPQLDKHGQKMVVFQTGIILAFAGLLLGVVSYAFAGVLASWFGNAALQALLKSFFWFPILSLPLLFVDSLLISKNKAGAAALFNLFSAAIQFISVVMPIILGYELTVVITTLNVGALVRLVVVLVYVLHIYKDVSFDWKIDFIQQQLRYSVPLGLSSILGTLTRQLDRIIVSLFFGAAGYAIYVIGATELPFVGIIAGSVITVITPEFIRLYQSKQNAELVRLWHSATCKAALFLLPLTAFLLAFGFDTIIVLFSESYVESVVLFRIFLLLLPLRITTYGSLLMAAGQSSLILKAAVGTIIINLILILVFLPMIGLHGVAVATVVSVYLMGWWQLYQGANLINVTMSEIFPWKKLGRIMILSVLSSAFAWFMTVHLSPGIIRLATGGLFFLIASIPLMWFIGGAREEFSGTMDAFARRLLSFRRKQASLSGKI